MKNKNNPEQPSWSENTMTFKEVIFWIALTIIVAFGSSYFYLIK